MTGGRASRRPGWLTRRRFLLGAGATATAGGAAAAIAGAAGRQGPATAAAGPGPGQTAPAAEVPDVPLGAQPAGLPARQHAWDGYLAADRDGNPVPPRFTRLLFFDVAGQPEPGYARLLEAALRTLERAYPWRPSGLLFAVAWGPGYFSDVLRAPSPVPPATALSAFEQPAIDDYHVCLHLAADDESRLAAVESALTRGAPLPGAGPAAPGRSTSPACCACASRGPASSAPGCLPGTRTSTASRPGTRCLRTRRCSWGSSPGWPATRPPRTT